MRKNAIKIAIKPLFLIQKILYFKRKTARFSRYFLYLFADIFREKLKITERKKTSASADVLNTEDET